MAVTRVTRARAGCAAGVVVSSVGVGLEFGAAWALIVGGAAIAGSFLVFYDVDERPPS